METFFFILPFIPLLFFWSKSKLLQWALMIMLIFFAGFRAITVGTDSVNYFLFFDRLSHNNLTFEYSRYEPLYKFINFLVFKLGFEYEGVTLISSILTIIPLYVVFNKSSKYPLYSWFVYLAFCYYFQSFNILRQCIAASWILLAYCYFDGSKSLASKENRKTLVFTIVAVLFHYTAILAFLVYFLYYLTVKHNKWFLIQFSTLSFGLLFSGMIFNAILKALPFYQVFNLKEDLLSNIINLIILNVAFIILNYFVKVKDKWFCLFFCYIVFSNLVLQLPFASRPIMYAGIALTVFFPNFIENNKLGREYKTWVLFFLTSYCLFRFSRLFGGGDIFPYDNVLYNF